MKYQVVNKAELQEWLVARAEHNLTAMKMPPFVDMQYEDGSGLVVNAINSAWKDDTTGELFMLEWAPIVEPAPFVAKLDVALAEQAGKKWMYAQVIRYVELQKVGASQEVITALVQLRNNLRSIETGL